MFVSDREPDSAWNKVSLEAEHRLEKARPTMMMK